MSTFWGILAQVILVSGHPISLLRLFQDTGLTLDQKSVGWIDGDDNCNNVFIGSADQNPCEKPFTLRNGRTYRLKHCGENTFGLYNEGDGSRNSACHYAQQNGVCANRDWMCY